VRSFITARQRVADLRQQVNVLVTVKRASRKRHASDLARIGTRVPEFYAGDLFCPVGTTPLYLGQPVALLVFEQFRRLRSGAPRAARWNFREVRRGNRPHQGA
jgi:hypothetical protein